MGTMTKRVETDYLAVVNCNGGSLVLQINTWTSIPLGDIRELANLPRPIIKVINQTCTRPHILIYGP